MKTPEQRIDNIVGQLKAVRKMLADEKDCVDILTQIKAARGSLDALVANFLTENLAQCAGLRSPKKKKEFAKILAELAKI